MTAGVATIPSTGSGWRLPAVTAAAWPATALVLLLGAQFWLIFVKSFNWDEFFHFSMVHQLHAGTLARPFQSLLARLLSWAPDVSDDLFAQMLAARVFVWSAFLVGLGSLYGLARQFVARDEAIWTTLVYLGAGNVFVHGFAIRADPIVMAALMLALYLLASRTVGWAMVLAVGVLIGFAGMLSVKAVFYAPCFAGIAWLRLSRADDKHRMLAWFAAIPLVTVATFAAIYLVHRAGLAHVPSHNEGGSFLANGAQWLTEGLFRQPRHTLVGFATAPVLAYALAKTPAVCRRNGFGRDRMIAIAGLFLPLLVIPFYRNVFPYFFVFLFAPVAVAVGPAVAELRRRFGPVALAAAICAIPLVKFADAPRDVMERQRALVDYVHRQIPAGAASFDFCGMIADQPRVVDHLVSGIGLANYAKRGVPLVARAVEAGELAFVIANSRPIALALAGRTAADGLLPADVAALHGNFVRAWGELWLPGKVIAEGANPVAIRIPADGAYTPDGAVTIDGTAHSRGDVVRLSAGRHVIDGPRTDRTVLWRGERLPAPGPQPSTHVLFTDY